MHCDKHENKTKNNSLKGNFPYSFLVLGMNTLLLGLFINLFIKKGTTNSLLIMTSFDILYTSIKYALLIYISFYVVSGVIYFIHSIKYKGKINYKEIVIMFGMSQKILTIGLILSIMFLYINLLIALAVLIIFVSMFIIQAYKGITIISKVDENKTLFISMISLTMMGMAYFIVIHKLIMSTQIYNTIFNYIAKIFVW